MSKRAMKVLFEVRSRLYMMKNAICQLRFSVNIEAEVSLKVSSLQFIFNEYFAFCSSLWSSPSCRYLLVQPPKAFS